MMLKEIISDTKRDWLQTGSLKSLEKTMMHLLLNTNLRTLLTVAASKKLQVMHYDVKIAHRNGDMDEELYMTQPEGFVKPGEQARV
jgi:hypothetical protein